MGGVGHGLGAAGDDDVRVTSYDCLGAEDQGFDRGRAHLVYRGCNGGLWETGAEGDLAGGVLSEAGYSVRIRRGNSFQGSKCLFLLCGEHIAYEDLLDIFGLDASTLNGSCSRISNLQLALYIHARNLLTLESMSSKLNGAQTREGAVVVVSYCRLCPAC